MKFSFLIPNSSVSRFTSALPTLSLVTLGTLIGCSSGSPSSVDNANDAATACSQPLMACNNQCVDVQNDPAHCGSCSNACSASQFCSKGACKAACDDKLTACSGSCVDLTNDSKNCGSCGRSCSVNSVCASNQCTFKVAADSIHFTPVTFGTNNYNININQRAHDKKGNLYLTGTLNGPVTIGDVRSNDKSTFFIAKIALDGKVAWFKSFGDDINYYVAGSALYIDAQGNMLVGGTFRGLIKLNDAITLTSTAPRGTTNYTQDGFLVKFDTNGNPLWAHTYGEATSYGDSIDDVQMDAQGNVFAVARLGNSLGGIVYREIQRFYKYTSDGMPMWASEPWTVTSMTSLNPARLQVDMQSNIVVLQQLKGKLTLPDGQSLESPKENNQYVYSSYFTKLAQDTGKALWLRNLPLDFPYASRFVLSPQGQLMFAGTFSKDVSLGALGSVNQIKLTNAGGSDIFWSTWDGATGQISTARSMGGLGNEFLMDLKFDTQGNLWMSGYFSGLAQFGDVALQSVSEGHYFVAKLDANGKVLWAERINDKGTILTSLSGPTWSVNLGFAAFLVENQGSFAWTGEYNNTAYIGGNTFTPKGGTFDFLFVPLKP